jgi:hypothetical protein
MSELKANPQVAQQDKQDQADKRSEKAIYAEEER